MNIGPHSVFETPFFNVNASYATLKYRLLDFVDLKTKLRELYIIDIYNLTNMISA